MNDLTKGLPIAGKEKELYEIYRRFEEDAAPYRHNAVCRKGCSFCCTFMGNVDITTLEGIMIRDHINTCPESEYLALTEAFEANRLEKEKGRNAPCPFLDKQGACRIYNTRPFSCRQLYSVKQCEVSGATIHRQAFELSRKAIASIQELDNTGYSGHLSFILHLLDDARFREFYIRGGFDPQRVRDFGKSHGIVINCRVRPPG